MATDTLDHDRLFKELLTTFFWEFLELLLPEVAAYAERDSVTFIDKEVFPQLEPGERYEADLLARMTFKDKPSGFLFHLENQGKAQAEFARRMFHYFAVFDKKLGMPVYPVAILSFDQPQREEPGEYRVEFPDRTVMVFSFRVIQLNRLNWRDFLRQPNPVACALMAKMKIAPEDRPKVKLECLRMLATLRLDRARSRLISGFVDTYLRLNAEELKAFTCELSAVEPQPLRESVMELTTSWMEEGIEIGLKQGREEGRDEGREEGRDEGREEGKRVTLKRIVLKQLAHRFGPLDTALQQRVENLLVERLEVLSEALLEFKSITECAAWLNSN